MKELTCIVCPRGCRLKVDEENGYAVTGNACVRGAEYGKNELTNPVRVLTSTVCIKGGMYKRLPVKTDRPIPKSDIFKVMDALNGICVSAPVKIGDVIVPNIAGIGANLVATKNMVGSTHTQVAAGG